MVWLQKRKRKGRDMSALQQKRENTSVIAAYDLIISYQHTGMNLVQQALRIAALKTKLPVTDDKVFCSLDQVHETHIDDLWEGKGEQSDSDVIDAVYDYCLDCMSNCTKVVFLVSDETESEGMRKELRLAQSKGLCIVVVAHSDMMHCKTEWWTDIRDAGEDSGGVLYFPSTLFIETLRIEM